MKKLIFILIFITSLNILATGDPVIGKAKAIICGSCHGIDGNSLVPTFPKLAGQGEKYLLKQLRDFKSGARKDAVMTSMTAILTDEDLVNIASFYASQKNLKNVAAVDKGLVILGGKIYKAGKKNKQITACIACHGATGKGIPSASFPALASQHAAYIIKQLKDFRQNALNAQTDANLYSRTNNYEGMMESVTKDLTNVEIDAIAQYISTLY